jgi:pimeloyl-ACP methyl ester carboxylesterase
MPTQRVVVSAVLLVTLGLSACGGSGTAGSATSSTATASETSAAPSPEPSTPAPLGAYTPTGKPTAVVPPWPQASIGAYCIEPKDGARRVVFPAASGARITGAVFGHGTAGVVLAHQSNGDLCQWWPYARTLVRAGYLVLSIDLEGKGSSGYAQYDLDQPAPYGLDVAAAVGYLRSQGAAKVVLVGASLGGISVLAGAAVARPAVNGVVSLSAPAEYVGIDARTAAARLTMPVLYAAATEDTDFAESTKTLHAATKSPKSLLIVPGSQHGVSLVDAGGNPAVQRAVTAFLAKYAR